MKSEDIHATFEPIKTNKQSRKAQRAWEKDFNDNEALKRRIQRKQEVRDEIDYAMRAKVFMRYGYMCYLCGKKGADTIDHVIPLIKGGTNDIKNLRPTHELCNKAKGNKILILPEELEQVGW